MTVEIKDTPLSTRYSFTAETALADYRMMYQSRQASLIGRKEVLTGKAKFGIFGGGKELPQIAMAKAFRNGDIRSGYYRDQTFAFASGIADIKQFFAQLYANPNLELEPHSGGRQMNSHFASRHFDEDGNWLKLTDIPQSSADGSPTASQMPRLVGLAQASKIYREVPQADPEQNFSRNGEEIAFGTIGNASCAEGHFWETLNAIGVIQAPMIISIWDDEYGISVSNEFQLTADLSEMISGFQRTEDRRGFDIYRVKGWDYEALVSTYQQAAAVAREKHIPAIIHVIEVTQPQGHSTSGSHERYKSKERLEWEKAHDCLLKMREYILEREFTTEQQLLDWEKEDRKMVRRLKNEAWQEYQEPIKLKVQELINIISDIADISSQKEKLEAIAMHLRKILEPARREAMVAAHRALLLVRDESHPSIEKLRQWRREIFAEGVEVFSSTLHNETAKSPQHVIETQAEYPAEPSQKSGFEILNTAFDHIFSQNPKVVAFGEDVGQLGDVNQGFAGLQAKHGVERIMDTGIREATIIGQAIGLAQRGLRPIAEIQYLDYLLYGLQTLSDDLATLHYRTRGGQAAPAIIRTRGHRLEGIWHAGSPLGMMIHALRGIHIAVPRNMTQAVGFYNTLLQGNDPAIVIEVLNAYRLKEAVPTNLHDITIPLGVPEIIREGSDMSVVTYGACCRIVMEAATQLADCGIEIEVIDVRTLLPFDTHAMIGRSLEKTNRILFVDEDVPGGATGFMMQQVLERQGGYFHLDSEPKTLSGTHHRPAYGDDGDYWSKPQVENIFQTVYAMMHEADPEEYPMFF
ncbi:MAG: thiamine pyrophosphate-dependent enzyme [Bacteroidota bacterium]